mgnify:CR=1 FL=1
MKITNKTIAGCILAVGLTMTSCDYLNVIPAETTTGSDMTKDRQAALNYLYSSSYGNMWPYCHLQDWQSDLLRLPDCRSITVKQKD